MCNLSQGILEQGIEIGKEQGIEIGKEQGIEIGEEQGFFKIVKKSLKNGMSDEQIKEFLEATDEQIRMAKEGLTI